MAYASLIELSPDYPRTIGTWRLPTALTGNGRWTVFCILGPPVVLALCAAQERRPRSHPALLAEVLLAIAALGAIASALLSLAPVQSTTEYAVRYVACWLLFRTLLNLKSDTPDRLLPTLLAGIGLTEALAALGQGLIATVPAWWPPSRPLPVHNGGAGSGWWLLRVEGLTAYHTILGAQLAILLPFVVLVSRRAGRGTVLPVGLILVALFCSSARASWFACLAGLLAAALPAFGARWPQARRYSAIVLLCLGCAGAVVGLQGRLEEQLVRYVPGQVTTGNLSERVAAQEVALVLWRQHPWLGVGYGNTAVAARHTAAYRILARRIVPAHNWLLLALAEGGLPGATVEVMLWLGPVVWLLYFGEGPRDASLLFAFTVLAVSQWFDYELTYWVGGGLLQVLLLVLLFRWRRAALPAAASR
jgi:O-antigen ligase